MTEYNLIGKYNELCYLRVLILILLFCDLYNTVQNISNRELYSNERKFNIKQK